MNKIHLVVLCLLCVFANYSFAKPSRVLDLSAVTGDDAGEIVVTFSQPAPQSGCTLVSNDIRYSTGPITSRNINNAASNVVAVSAVGAEVQVIISGLDEGVTYRVAQMGVDSCGKSIMSNSPSATAGESDPEPTVATLSLTWDIPDLRENGNELLLSEIGGYELVYNEESSPTYTTILIEDHTVDSYELNNLTYGHEFCFMIAVFDTEGLYSDYSDELCANAL